MFCVCKELLINLVVWERIWLFVWWLKWLLIVLKWLRLIWMIEKGCWCVWYNLVSGWVFLNSVLWLYKCVKVLCYVCYCNEFCRIYMLLIIWWIIYQEMSNMVVKSVYSRVNVMLILLKLLCMFLFNVWICISILLKWFRCF